MTKTKFWIFLLVFAMLSLICKDIFLTRAVENLEKSYDVVHTELEVIQKELNELEDTLIIETE